ncbi:MAG: ice-binding family protein [Caldiserica bacterium]|nr:ice-binding family protein [Caldisericota bacterium]
MKKVLATLVALALIMSMFTGVFAPMPATRAASVVNLGTAGNFVILAKTAITTTGATSISGDIGISPAAASSIAGFGLIMDSTNTFSTSSLVEGKVYASNYALPTPTKMSTAVSDMQAAYTAAAGQSADFTELGSGTVANKTLVPGVYKWSTPVTITTDLILAGGPDDVWVFQMAQTLDLAAGMKILLSGGAQAKNVFWQVAGTVNLLAGSHFEGIMLAQTNIAMRAGATFNGRLLAQTAVTLISTTGDAPAAPGLAGTITIIKNTVPNGQQDFNFTIVGPSLNSSFALDDDADPTLPNWELFGGLLAGTYIISEQAVAGYSLIGIAGATSFDLSTMTATVTLVAGAPVSSATVTFTNMQRSGTIRITKDTVPDGPQDFSFTMTHDPYQTAFSLDDDADGTLLNWVLFGGLLPDTYTITEAPAVDYVLTGIAGATSSDLGMRTATVTLTLDTPSAAVTFTNTLGVPDIHLVKSVSPMGAVFPGTRLTYTLTYSNSGTAYASAVITDVLDGWLDESSLIIDSWTVYDPSTRTVRCGVGMTPGYSGTWTFSVKVRAIQNVFLLIRNTGLFVATPGGPGTSNTVVTPVLPIVPGPEEPPVIPPPPPSIAITVTAPEPLCVEAYLPYQVCFTNGVPPYTYTVDFGDGTPIITGTTSSSCVTLEHAYLAIKQYAFSVTVHDSKGMESTSRQTFTPVDCTKKVVVYHHNFFIGYPNGTFQPDGNVTRAEVAAAMSRALGLGWTTDPSGFSDLKATHWAAGFITLMTQEGFMQGDTGGTFRPDDPMTRAEAAAAFLRIAGMTPVLNPSSSSFKDVQPMSWAAGYIEAARTAGLLAGYPDNTFRPADLLSRAEFATLASNALGRVLTTTNTRVNPQYEVKWPDVTPDFWAYNYILEVSTPHTVTNPTRLTRTITLTDRKIPLFSEGDNGIITFLQLGTTITAIVPVDGLQADGSDPAPRQVKVRILNHERP